MESFKELADYGVALFLLGVLAALVFYWLKHMIPSWKEEKAADVELKRSIPQLADSLRQVAEYQREISQSQEEILACSERMRHEFQQDSQRKDEKLETLISHTKTE